VVGAGTLTGFPGSISTVGVRKFDGDGIDTIRSPFCAVVVLRGVLPRYRAERALERTKSVGGRSSTGFASSYIGGEKKG